MLVNGLYTARKQHLADTVQALSMLWGRTRLLVYVIYDRRDPLADLPHFLISYCPLAKLISTFLEKVDQVILLLERRQEGPERWVGGRESARQGYPSFAWVPQALLLRSEGT